MNSIHKLATEAINARSPSGDIEHALLEMAATAKSRREQYGDNWRVVGDVLALLYPKGLTAKTPAEWNTLVAVIQVVNKLCRLAASGNTHLDSAHDLGPYAAMAAVLIEQRQTAEERARGSDDSQ